MDRFHAGNLGGIATYSESESMPESSSVEQGSRFDALAVPAEHIRLATTAAVLEPKARPIVQMFITEPYHEFVLPAGLTASGTRHWRMLRLSLHAPWFVLTVEIPDGDVYFARTVCIAWDTDLVDFLESLGDNAKAVALLCMTPGWCSPTGQWSARKVREVWSARASDGRVVILRDEHGQEFGDRVREEPLQAVADHRLILRID